MFHILHRSLPWALASILMLVPALTPWAHVGCQHDHGAHKHAATSESSLHAHDHSSCGHHHHHDDCQTEENASLAKVDHRHQSVDNSDCAACRFLSLAAVAPEITDQVSSEAICIATISTEPATPIDGRYAVYFSRGPPQLG
jgi:hypothetical protein